MKIVLSVLASIAAAMAQIPNPTAAQASPPDSSESVPIYRIRVVSRTTKAINYHHRKGTTRIDFRGTELMPAARGEATVKSELGSTKIETRLDRLTAANQFGPEYMTYVMWAITPEGRAINIGEVVLEGDDAKLLSTTNLQSFALIVTAEPYFAVTQPSDVVVAENFVRKDTTGTIQDVEAKYELLKRGQYVADRGKYKPVRVDPKGPLQLAEAENAVEIARLAGAEQYAADTFNKARIGLENATGLLNHGNHRKESETNAREAAQMAEDARIITIRKMNEEAQALQKAEAERAVEQASLEQQRRAQADAERAAAEAAKREADLAAARAERERAAADAARAAATEQQRLLAAQAAEARASASAADQARLQADQARLQAEKEKAQLRERLRQQLNAVLETEETARGLIVNIADVLFDFDKYELKPGAREKMAKVSGILLAYPGLKIELEGHTDSVGSEEYNQVLSERRANSVRAYLIGQGVPADTVSAAGLGKANPVASNSNEAGRLKNRRVEMVVSGEPIGIVGSN
ncbi:OmpA family protein [Paludibaculum fermentans]|uniref:OmpA family protein n=1 Tax=Paludibaculum fermentans TaxID=1473598 RepID=A0A7S7NV80_PALFE|nr:OmpA family protein [Paludibaculum fermentans]QOY90379.1 OmpA family protein [Paludibaculum fermentans]